MKTYQLRKEDIKRDWRLIDASGVVLGRLSSKIAKILQGKEKPLYTPHLDTGDYVVVTSAEKIRLTGKKLEQKLHRTHTGYPGGLKSTKYKTLIAEKPEKVIKLAVGRMLPKTKLGRKMLKKLYVYRGMEHPHQGQVKAG